MSSRKRNLDELVRQQTLLGSRLPKGYSNYAGGSLDISNKIATVDMILEHQLLPEKFIPFIKLYRIYLDKQRQAFFMTVGSDVLTQLAAIVGNMRTVKDYGATRTSPEIVT